MPSGEEVYCPPGEKSGTITKASQDAPQEQITETPQAQVKFNPPQMSSGASALQPEKSGDGKADTMETYDKVDHNADDNPVIKDKNSILDQNQDDALNETSETDVRSMPSGDMAQENKTTHQDSASPKEGSNTESPRNSDITDFLNEQMKHIDSNNVNLLDKKGIQQQLQAELIL